MLNRIKKYFSMPPNENVLPTKLASPDNQPVILNEHKSNTWVYIWNMTSQNVGHAAIQVGGDSSKMMDEQPGEYVSIHPKNIPAMGPTIILPLPAKLATTLSADMESIAASRHGSNLDTMDYIPISSNPDKSPTSLSPDKIFKIEGLDTEAMEKHINTIKNKVESGESAYQLLPKVNTVGFVDGFLRDSAAFIGQDPVDVEIHRRSLSNHAPTKRIHVDNCATLVSDILNRGNMHIDQSKTPWGLTPNGLADQLHQNQTKLNKL
ncbi:MAG: hypothetical protein KIT56_05310 [Gammaproteobacteria bacterium]|nr:hypothetical protein [Gammaproteobacteria bacterium]MCW5583293.1 hypothetical protein [Gammaproteobacteria bacterium]